MHIQQLYTNCLAEAAYYIESNGEAAIIDPIRETEPYLALAKERGTKIKYIFETHFHADFVSGHIDLANKTGAEIIYGPMAETDYKVRNLKDGEELKVGHLTIRAIHTPGHTPESTCYLLLDESYQEYCVFTGDTLFVGDVGRPDLLDGKMTKEQLAGMMYDSLNNKIKKLPDEVIVYPAHGPGSSCGKNLGPEKQSTIGTEKQMNYALADMKREDFIKVLTEGLTPPPAYFFSDAMINKQGYAAIDGVMKRNMKALSIPEFEKEVASGTVILDTRCPDDFEKGFIPGSINIGLNGMYAIWAGTILDINVPLAIVCDAGKEEESVMRLARVGYEKVNGFLDGGVDAWKNAGKPMDTVTSIDPPEFADRVHNGEKVLDVRKITEAEEGHVKGATVIPLAELKQNLDALDKNTPVIIHCRGGYRSMVAASLMKRQGFKDVTNVHGGWSHFKNIDLPIQTGAPSNLIAE